MMETFYFTNKSYDPNFQENIVQCSSFSVFLRRLKILPSRTALSVIESRSKPTNAVSKNIILMITTKLFVFSHDAHVCSLRREVPNDCMTS